MNETNEKRGDAAMERYQAVDEKGHKSTVRILRLMSESDRGREIIKRLLKIDEEGRFCDYPKSTVLDFWSDYWDSEFEVRGDESYYGMVTVFLKGRRVGYNELPFYGKPMSSVEMDEITTLLNELTEINKGIEKKEEAR